MVLGGEMVLKGVVEKSTGASTNREGGGEVAVEKGGKKGNKKKKKKKRQNDTKKKKRPKFIQRDKIKTSYMLYDDCQTLVYTTQFEPSKRE